MAYSPRLVILLQTAQDDEVLDKVKHTGQQEHWQSRGLNSNRDKIPPVVGGWWPELIIVKALVLHNSVQQSNEEYDGGPQKRVRDSVPDVALLDS